MFSKRMRLTVFFAFAVTLGGVFAYVAPASTSVDPVAVDDRPGIAIDPTYRSWGEDLSANAVDAAGIETDLDGNASSLFPSDRGL
jgi:hypothetical protein